MPDYCATSLRNNISQLLFGKTYELGIGGKLQLSESGCGNFLNNVKKSFFTSAAPICGSALNFWRRNVGCAGPIITRFCRQRL